MSIKTFGRNADRYKASKPQNEYVLYDGIPPLLGKNEDRDIEHDYLITVQPEEGKKDVYVMREIFCGDNEDQDVITEIPITLDIIKDLWIEYGLASFGKPAIKESQPKQRKTSNFQW